MLDAEEHGVQNLENKRDLRYSWQTGGTMRYDSVSSQQTGGTMQHDSVPSQQTGGTMQHDSVPSQ